MPQFDTLIAGGRVVSESFTAEHDVGIRDGRVVALLAPGTSSDAAQVVDARGLYVVPGAIDTHTHIRVPVGDQESEDDFATATAAAAVSGTTTIIDFIHTKRDESPSAAADLRLAQAEGECAIDYAFHPILTSARREVRAEIPSLIRAGFASFKMYTTYEGHRLDDGDIWLLMEAIARGGGLPGLHAENHELLTRLGEEMRQDGHTQPSHFPLSRPPLVEAESIAMIALYARRLEAPFFIFHLSGSEGLQAVRDARDGGLAAFGETCTHYLTFDAQVFEREDAWKFVITPPIRDAAARDGLWQAIRDGVIWSVGSDHVAYTLAQKSRATASFLETPAGAPGIEVRIPMLLSSGVNAGRLTLEQFVAVSAGRPARVMGLAPQKGSLSVGSDADLVLIDLDRPWSIDHGPSLSGAQWTIYGGLSGTGYPRLTMVRGQIVARDGKFVGMRGTGRFVERHLSPSLLASKASSWIGPHG